MEWGNEKGKKLWIEDRLGKKAVCLLNFHEKLFIQKFSFFPIKQRDVQILGETHIGDNFPASI